MSSVVGVAGGDLAVRADRVDVEGVGPGASARAGRATAGDALLDGRHDVSEERQVSPEESLVSHHPKRQRDSSAFGQIWQPNRSARLPFYMLSETESKIKL